MSQLPHFFERIPILGEWVVIHHQRFGDTSLLTLQEIRNLTDLKFWPFLSVHISVHKSVCEAIASRLMHGPKAICHELSPFSISIWICPDDLPVSSVRLQLQQQPLSCSTESPCPTSSAMLPFTDLFSDMHYIPLQSSIIRVWLSAQHIMAPVACIMSLCSHFETCSFEVYISSFLLVWISLYIYLEWAEV